MFNFYGGMSFKVAILNQEQRSRDTWEKKFTDAHASSVFFLKVSMCVFFTIKPTVFCISFISNHVSSRKPYTIARIENTGIIRTVSAE